MIDLYALACSCEEALMHGVHSHRHIVASGMPVAIRACRLGKISLRLYPLLLAVFLDHRSPTLTTHLQGNTVGIRPIGCMAVETSSRYHRLRQDSILIEGMYIALIDADVATHFIAGFDTPIGEPPLVETVFADKDIKVVILRPMPVGLDTDGECNLTALVLCRQRLPVVNVKVCPFAADVNLTAFTATVNGGAVLNNINQFKFDNASLSDFYYANLYFYDAANTQPDTESPSAPANLTVNAAATSVGLTWTASTDNVGVTGYNIYVNGTKVGSSNTTSYTVTGLQPETTYQIAVEAYDAAGNTSNRATRNVSTTEGASTPCHNTFSAITASRNVVNQNGNWNQINGLHTVNGNSVTVNVGNANYTNLYVVLSGDDQALTAGTTYVFTGRLTATKASTVKIYIESRDNNEAQHLFDNNPITLQANTPVDFSFEATNPQALTNPDMTISIDNGPTNTTYTLTDISIREKTCATNIEETEETGNLNSNLGIYPNPARGKAYVMSDKEVSSVALFSLTGAQVATFDSAEIDLTGVDKGFYLVVVTYTDGSYEQGKLICR